MAVGLKTRIIYKEPSTNPIEGAYWAGEYKLLMRAKAFRARSEVRTWWIPQH